MRKLLALLLFPALTAGCTTLQYPKSYSAQSSIEQQLRWQAFEAVSLGIVTYDTNRMDEIRKQVSYKKDELALSSRKEQPAIRKEIEVLSSRLNNLSNLKVLLKRLETAKLYVDILAGADRQYVYRYLIMNSLKARHMLVVPTEKEADYKLQIVVKQDGIDEQFFNLLFILLTDKVMGTAEVDVAVTDLKTNEVIYEDTVEGGSHYTRSYILGIFGPIDSTSLR
jgi:hypothetical protein